MKKLLTLLALVVLMSGVAFANTYTEYFSRGGTPLQLLNIAPIVSIYPSQLMNYSDMAALEYGPTIGANAYGYAYVDIGMGIAGISLVPKPAFGDNTIFDNAATMLYNPPGAINTAPTNVVGLSYANDFGGMGFGLELLFGANTNDTKNILAGDPGENDTTSLGNSYLGVVLGATLNVGMPLDLGVSLAFPGSWQEVKTYGTANNSVLATDDTNATSGLALTITARTTIGNWIANLDFHMINLNYNVTTKTDANLNGNFTDAGDTNLLTTYQDGNIGVDLLAGYNLKASETMSFIIGSGINFYTDETYLVHDENKITNVKNNYLPAVVNQSVNIGAPIFLSVQCNLNKDWGLISGFSKSLVTWNSTTANNQNNGSGTLTKSNLTGIWTIDNAFNAVTATLGVTGKIGDITVDAMLNPAALLSGPYFISGNSAGALATSIALAYKWGK